MGQIPQPALERTQLAIPFEFLDVFGDTNDSLLNHFLRFGVRKAGLNATA
jgi:hypothetical protein